MGLPVIQQVLEEECGIINGVRIVLVFGANLAIKKKAKVIEKQIFFVYEVPLFMVFMMLRGLPR